MDQSGDIFVKLKGTSQLLAMLLALVTSLIIRGAESDRQPNRVNYSQLALPPFNETAFVLGDRTFVSVNRSQKETLVQVVAGSP